MAQETFLAIQKLNGYYDRCKLSRTDPAVQSTIINSTITPYSTINLNNDDGSTFSARFIASGDKDSITSLVNSRNNFNYEPTYGQDNFSSQAIYTDLNLTQTQSQNQNQTQARTQKDSHSNHVQRSINNNVESREQETNRLSNNNEDALAETIRKIIAQEMNKNVKQKKTMKRNHDSIDLTGLDDEQAEEESSFSGSMRKKKKKDDLDTNQLGICVDMKYYEMMKTTSFVSNGRLVTRPERISDILSRGYPSAVADLVFTEAERYHGFIGQSPRKRHSLVEERIEYFKCCLIKGLSDHFSSYNMGYTRFSKLWSSWRESVNQRWRDQRSLRDKQRLSEPPFPRKSLIKCYKSSCNYCLEARETPYASSPPPTPSNPYSSFSPEPKSPLNAATDNQNSSNNFQNNFLD